MDELLAQDINIRETKSFVFPKNLNISLSNSTIITKDNKDSVTDTSCQVFKNNITCKLSDLKTKERYKLSV